MKKEVATKFDWLDNPILRQFLASDHYRESSFANANLSVKAMASLIPFLIIYNTKFPIINANLRRSMDELAAIPEYMRAVDLANGWVRVHGTKSVESLISTYPDLAPVGKNEFVAVVLSLGNLIQSSNGKAMNELDIGDKIKCDAELNMSKQRQNCKSLEKSRQTRNELLKARRAEAVTIGRQINSLRKTRRKMPRETLANKTMNKMKENYSQEETNASQDGRVEDPSKKPLGLTAITAALKQAGLP